MTDAFGTRGVFSVLLPATNAIVEPDMSALRLPGITNQSYRFAFPGLPGTVEALIELMQPALNMALACEPDRIVVAYSPEYMPDGLAATAQLRTFFDSHVPVPVTLASEAVPRALAAVGARRIGLVTPFQDEANVNAASFFAAHGITVVRQAGFASAEKGRAFTARISESEVRAAFAQVNTPEVDTLVQIGTALVCAGFIESLEVAHGKPVIAVNAATYWHALREHGFDDRVAARGRLFSSF